MSGEAAPVADAPEISVERFFAWDDMTPRETGDWVRLEDHVAAIGKLTDWFNGELVKIADTLGGIDEKLDVNLKLSEIRGRVEEAHVAAAVKQRDEELRERLEKLWLYRCPHHGLIDGGHYSREREWGPEDGCPLLTADEEECGEDVERFDPPPQTSQEGTG
jgi:hypothetical protein